MVKKYKWFFMVFLVLISVFSLFLSKLLMLWSFLEMYNILFIVYIFLKQGVVHGVNQDFLVYFGMIQLFSSMGLILGMVLSFDLFISLMLLVKMGSFPMNEWVVYFFTNVSLGGGYLFFSMNKMIPLIFFQDYISLKFSVVFLVLILNWLISFYKILSSLHMLEVMGWSSMVSKGYFLFIMQDSLSGMGLVSLMVYSVILLLMFSLYKSLHNSSGFLDYNNFILILFVLMLLLFGVPPMSMFLFKMVMFFQIIKYFSLMWVYLMLVVFFLLGVGYFIFFLNYSIFLKDLNWKFLGKGIIVVFMKILSMFILLMVFFYVVVS